MTVYHMEVLPCQPLISPYPFLWFIYTGQLPEAGAYVLLGWGLLPPPGLPAPGGLMLLLPPGLWFFWLPHSQISEKWLFLGKGMSFKRCFFLLWRELGDGKHSRALVLTPHVCFFAFAFILIWWHSAEPPSRHPIVNSVPSD